MPVSRCQTTLCVCCSSAPSGLRSDLGVKSLPLSACLSVWNVSCTLTTVPCSLDMDLGRILHLCPRVLPPLSFSPWFSHLKGPVALNNGEMLEQYGVPEKLKPTQ